ncbi:MAG: type VI secretion system tube protein Hcp [Chitinophagaceae bacterium]|nr:type VI secretion system tube protein Hcp [Chitinophagaceae bacterium]
MALNSYLKIKGQKQGDFKGSVIQKGREGWIEVNAFDHEILSPRDAATGQATGRRQHKPLVITKELDQSSTMLLTALISNETLSSVELKCFAPNKLGAAGGQGVETLQYTIALSNAHIVSVRTQMLNNKNPDLVRYEQFEEVAFTYEKISWTWHLGNKTAADSWAAAV